VTFTLTGGEVHDSKAFATLMGTGWIKRLGRGRPRLKPDRLAADKAYSSGVIRSALRRRGIEPVIPTKSNERPAPGFDRDAYRERNRVERLINKLKQFRRIATRYEKRAANYLGMITIAAILLWLSMALILSNALPSNGAGCLWQHPKAEGTLRHGRSSLGEPTIPLCQRVASP